MCIRDSFKCSGAAVLPPLRRFACRACRLWQLVKFDTIITPVSYTHLRAHETVLDLVCRLLLEKKNKHNTAHQTVRDNDNYTYNYDLPTTNKLSTSHDPITQIDTV